MSQDYGSFLRNILVSRLGETEQSFTEQGELKPGERREIAVLFLDLGGFTALSEELDHEAVHNIARGVMDALVKVTELFGGYVDKIEGDRIMVLFGARKAGENDSTRAVSCGFQMLDVIRTANDVLSDTGIPITARIGINSGPVTVAPDAIGHLTAMGNTVNLASRMEEAAEADTILVPETIYEKCRELFSWENIGTIKLKGIRNAVQAWRPTASVSSNRPRWERISLTSSSDFVGRSDELHWLGQKLHEQNTGNTGKSRLGGVKHIVLSIVGEAGIGKSRMIHEFIKKQCCDENTMILRGHSLSYAQPAYCLWTSLLRGLLELGSDTRLEYEEFRNKVLSLSDDSELMASVPFLAETLSIRSGDKRLDELDSKAIALETRIAFRNLLKALAGSKNLIVVLDDLHWIDSTCKSVLEFIIGNCSTEKPILFLLVYRLEADDGSEVEFDIKPNYAEKEALSLLSMDDKACLEIITEMLSGISSQGTARLSNRVEGFLLEHSHGNPFFLEELVLDIVESGILIENNNQWVFSGPVAGIHIPSSLTGLLQSRLDRLSDEWKGVLQKSSVLGVEFKLRLYRKLVEALAIKEDSKTALDTLERRQFLIGVSKELEQKYMFRHIMIHDTAYQSMLESNRKILHRITARLIEEMYPDDEQEIADILAHHWERADVRDKAIHWGIINLKYMAEAYQHEKTLDLSRKLESWILEEPLDAESSEKLFEVLMHRIRTLDLLGRRKEQEQLLLEMKDIADSQEMPASQGKIQSALGNVFRTTGRFCDAEECYRNALEIHRRMENHEAESEVICNQGILSRIQGRTDEAVRYFEKALEMNREEGNRRTEGVLLGNLGNCYLNQRRMDKAVEYYEKALEINREVGDRRNEGIALGNLGNTYISKDDIEDSLNYYKQALDLHREVGNRRSEGLTLGNMGVLYFEHDRFVESRECYEQALEIHREVGNRRLEANIYAELALLGTMQDDYAGVLSYYMDAFRIIEELELADRGFEQFAEVYRYLISSSVPEMEVSWPNHWDTPETE